MRWRGQVLTLTPLGRCRLDFEWGASEGRQQRRDVVRLISKASTPPLGGMGVPGNSQGLHVHWPCPDLGGCRAGGDGAGVAS